jgi:hypothetical protein
MEVGGQNHAAAALPTGKNSRCPSNKKAGGNQNPYGRFEKKREKSLSPGRNLNLRPISLHPSHYTN